MQVELHFNTINRMKSVAVLCLLVATLVLAEAARIRREEKYTTKYDNIDLDEILRTKRLMDNYVNCVLNKGKCSPDGTELKKHITDALSTECTKCSDRQKEGAEKVINHLIKERPEDWKALKELYDPDGTYSKKYEEEEKKLRGTR